MPIQATTYSFRFPQKLNQYNKYQINSSPVNSNEISKLSTVQPNLHIVNMILLTKLSVCCYFKEIMYLERLLSLCKEHKVAIIGLGQENLQFIEWLVNTAKLPISQILLADQRVFDTSQGTLAPFKNYPDHIFSGPAYLDILKDESVKMVFKAPGIWSLKPEFKEFRRKNGNDSIHSSLVFFFEKYRKQIISVTGTKGKSTTSSLLNHLLTSSKKITSHYCGNTTNISPYQFWTDLSEEIDTDKYFVIETSSFQLQDIAFAQISAAYGIITNYFVDHQDQHQNPEEYWKAKDAVFNFQLEGETTLITQTVETHTQSKNNMSSTVIITPILAHEIAANFVTSLQGIHNQSNLSQAIITYLSIIDQSLNIRNKKELLSVVKANKHNLQNALDTYKPLAHRQEIFGFFTSKIAIKTRKSNKVLSLTVSFVDDGAATEPDAVVAAINTLTSSPNQYIWLFIAGKDKGGDLANLSKTILDTQLMNRLYKIHYCGQIGQNLLSNIYQSLGISNRSEIESFKQTVIDELTTKVQIVHDFEKWLTDQVSQLEEVGDQDKISKLLAADIKLNITLSPCGSSFDEFSSYKERCLWFKSRVSKLE
jgi:UDP-N-acetylmuramoylalanine-D-glutamate ligase